MLAPTLHLLGSTSCATCCRFYIGRRRTPPLPDHCLAFEFGDTWLGMLAHLLKVVVGAVATADVIIEFFTGTINQQTGMLEPKSLVSARD